jgi:hypothetical protein
MLRSFTSWLDDFIAERGTIGLLSGALGIIAFGGTLALVFGDSLLRTAAIVSVFLLTCGVMSQLVAARAVAVQRYQRAERLLGVYTASLDQAFGRDFRVLSWKDHLDVAANGDTVEVIDVRLVVESDGLRFFRLRNGSGWPQPERHRRRVRVEVNTLQETNGQAGTSWDVTSSWLANGRLEILAHCHMPTARGVVLAVRLTYYWPRMCRPLVRGERDHFWLRFLRGADEVEYIVLMPDNREVNFEYYGPSSGELSVLSSTLDPSGRRTQITLTATDVPPEHNVGMWLQAKKRR